MSAYSPQSKPAWGPHLLLAGLVTILVFGACGTTNLLREDAARQPLVLRHHVQRGTFLLLPVYYDTLNTDLIYQGQVLLPTAAECVAPAKPKQRLLTRRVRHLAGPEPRWVFELSCPDGQTRSLYLLRLSPGGPAFHRIGALHGWMSYNLEELIPLTDTLTYFADTNQFGALFDWRSFESTPVVLPALDALRWRAQGPDVHYSLSPDRQILARVYRETRPAAPVAPGTSPAQAAQSLVRLTIDSYDLRPQTTRRLILDSLRLPPVELPLLTEWTQTNGRWELLPRR